MGIPGKGEVVAGHGPGVFGEFGVGDFAPQVGAEDGVEAVAALTPSPRPPHKR
ncbi:MAG: hypothetical protein ACK4WK_02955 [Anaerolineae bacterium]